MEVMRGYIPLEVDRQCQDHSPGCIHRERIQHRKVNGEVFQYHKYISSLPDYRNKTRTKIDIP